MMILQHIDTPVDTRVGNTMDSEFTKVYIVSLVLIASLSKENL